MTHLDDSINKRLVNTLQNQNFRQRDMSGATSCNYNHTHSAASSRPKVVLINPNFQRKQLSTTHKTIHINPLFKSSNVLNKTSPATSASHLNVPDRNTVKHSFGNNIAPANVSNSFHKLPTAFSSMPKPHLNQNKFIESKFSTSLVAPLSSGMNVEQPKKTYINPKFLKCEVSEPQNTQATSIFLTLRKEDSKPSDKSSKLNSVLITPNTSNFTPSEFQTQIKKLPVISHSSKNVEDKVIPTSTSSNNLSRKNDQPVNLVFGNSPRKPVYSPNSSILEKNVKEKKKLNLLKLKRITKLAQLSRLSILKEANKKLSFQTSATFAHSKRDQSKRFKLSAKYQPSMHWNNSENNLRKKTATPNKSFINHYTVKNNLSKNKSRRNSEIRKQLKNRSKYKLIRQSEQNDVLELPCTSQSLSKPVNLVEKNESVPIKSKPPSTNNESLFYASKNKFIKINESQTMCNKLMSSHKQNESPSETKLNNRRSLDSRKLLYVSKRKLVRKSSASSINFQKNLFKSKSVIKNINLLQSKNTQRNLKINFRPSRTSSDVINKRLMLRKVSNRYKILKVKQDQFVSNNPFKYNLRLKKYASSKPLIKKSCLNNSRFKSKNSSFITVGKNKLIRKSIMRQKQQSIKQNIRLLKINNSRFRKVNNTNFQRNLIARKAIEKMAEQNRNLVNNSLVSIGKTKLIKRSLLLCKKQIDVLKSKRNNVAATSVIKKQFRKHYKSLKSESSQNFKPTTGRDVKQKVKCLLSPAKRNLLTRRRIALRCKNNIPCEIFRKFGRCKKLTLGKCFQLHDKKYVSICPTFVRGACKSEKCLLSHEIIPEKMPTCHHFLQGACSRDNCPYPHVKLSAKALICRDFVRGFCPKGVECNNLHVLMCPELEKKGICSDRQNCKFVHRKKKAPKKLKVEKNLNTENVSDEKLEISITDDTEKLAKENVEPSKRYFVNSSEEDLESFVPSRPNLGLLPSFIPLSSCDTSKEDKTL